TVSLTQWLDVALVEELDIHIGIPFFQLAQLAVLARDERLLHHRDLEIEVLLGQVEVRSERLEDATALVDLELERPRLVQPGNAVVVEDLGALELGLVLEDGRLGAAICLENRGLRRHRRQDSHRSGRREGALYTSFMPAPDQFTIAHISDLHCGGPYFVPNLMERAISEINDLDPDLVVCSGDLTTFGFKPEYVQAKEYLSRLECKSFVVMPGNHDARTVRSVHFEELFGQRNSVLRIGNTTIVAVDSTEPDLDHGQIGRGRYPWIEEEFADDSELRIFVLHHHLLPVPGTGRERNVVYDAGDALECLQRARVQMVLSGHKHVPYAWRLENMFILNAGTVSSLRLRGNTRPCYNVIEVEGTHVSVWRRYPVHGQERIIQFSTETLEFEKYTARIEGELSSRS